MFLSIIIPTCNRNDLLGKCLDLLAPTVQQVGEMYEVIVTDDGKEHPARKLIEEQYPWVTWLEGPRRGPAANRNNGARNSSGDWLVFIDDDCLPDTRLLYEYKNIIMKNPGTLVFEGCILPDDWRLLNADMAECPVNKEGGLFWSANICIHTSIFKKVSGFDESFPNAAQEDQDMHARLKQMTMVLFVSKAFVIHPVRTVSVVRKIARIPMDMKNWLKFELKYNSKNVIEILMADMFMHLKAAFKRFFRFHFKWSLYHLTCFFYAFWLLISKGKALRDAYRA